MQRHKRIIAGFVFCFVSSLSASGDVMQVGNRIPGISFWGADGKPAKYDQYLGKKSIVFVFASW